MRTINNKSDRGVAGLTILLSLVTMLFVIGLLVMIFSLMGGEMRDATYTATTVTVTDEAHLDAEITANAELDGIATYRGTPTCTIGTVANLTAGGTVLTSGNYTVANCNLTNSTTAIGGDGGDWYVNYTFVYDADNSATNVMNDTVVGISAVTDWYPIFIVIGAMVVLILLTVIIITAIRGSGLMVGESA